MARFRAERQDHLGDHTAPFGQAASEALTATAPTGLAGCFTTSGRETGVDITHKIAPTGDPERLRGDFLWETGTMRDLGPATGYGAATGVNERGQVVGYAIVGEDHLPRAVLWQNGAIIDLPSLPGTGEAQAEAINEKGQIIGWSKTKNDKRHAVLWTLKP